LPNALLIGRGRLGDKDERQGRRIDKRVIVDTPEAPFYTAHFKALETEFRYALSKHYAHWVKSRLSQHKDSVIDDDPNLPAALRPRGEELYETYLKLAMDMSRLPVKL
jgi:hypothetical protein